MSFGFRKSSSPLMPAPTTWMKFSIIGATAGLFLGFVLAVPACIPPAPLRVGTLPTLDALPLTIDSDKPIYEENKLVLTTVFFASAPELHRALVSGEVDAAITDLIGALLLDRGEERSKIVRVAMRASPQRPKFAIMVGGSDPAISPLELENASIAVSGEASHRFIADRLLAAGGLAKWIEREVAGPEAGLDLLRKGEVRAALLPELLIWQASKEGCRTVLDDGRLMLGQTVVVFNQAMVRSKPVLIRKFLIAYEQAARELNVRPGNYQFLIPGTVGLPPELTRGLTVPVFPFPGQAPAESEVELASAWLVEKKMLEKPVQYRQAVNAGFLWDPFEFKPAACCGW
ncbi:MAG: ABC transporter substrate-binding protein [Chloroflexi bacterium]|nr:ABC transporter substrate-binding protein [Chloroflexota bacterium]